MACVGHARCAGQGPARGAVRRVHRNPDLLPRLHFRHALLHQGRHLIPPRLMGALLRGHRTAVNDEAVRVSAHGLAQGVADGGCGDDVEVSATVTR